MTPEHRAELSKLEDIAGEVSREYHEYLEKIARPIKGGAAGERAFLCLLAIRAWEKAHIWRETGLASMKYSGPEETWQFAKIGETVVASNVGDQPAPRRRGRPPKAAA